MIRLFYPFLLISLLLNWGCEPAGDADAEQANKSKPLTTNFAYEEYTIGQLREGFNNGDFTVESVIQSYLNRIEAVDDSGPTLNAVIEINPDALEIARKLDEELQNGNSRGPMHGIPVLLKDNIDTHDKMHTTAGSRVLKDSRPDRDSFLALKLREAGAVLLGKANLSEWANYRGSPSSSGWSGMGGQTRNPYILNRNPCGSSSGPGAAVSANLCMVAIGTETNGSIVCPSNANGVVGIKPTVGLLSRSGIVPISFTQDTPGPMARTVTDAAVCLGAMTGVDPRDSKTAASEGKYHADYTRFLNKNGLEGKRIGWYKPGYGRYYKVDTVLNRAIEGLKSQGAAIIEIEEITKGSAGRYSSTVLSYEFKDGINNYLASLGEDAPVKSLAAIIEFNKQDSVELKYFDQSRMEAAQARGDLSEKEYRNALETMHRMTREEGIDRVMEENNLDAIVAVTGSPAWKTDWVNGDSFHLGSSTPAAVAGYPSITVPMGKIQGLPLNLSFFGKAWSEPKLLEIAYAYEQATQHRFAPRFLEGQP